ncbi:uncharacterized protein JCM10292_003434 [Rhodotorula paludigena]|uniref:uncharacterized protein n=1 Tax=Rhodotorula paludigena TaxID=86838 RepID=UPI00317B3873
MAAPPALDRFLALSPDARTQPEALAPLSQVLQACAQGFEPAPEQRRKLVSALVTTGSKLADKQDSPTRSSFLALVCTLLKILGRSPAGTEELGRSDGVRVLLRLGGLHRIADLPKPAQTPPLADDDNDDNDYDDEDEAAAAERAIESFETDPLSQPEAEALRCLANTLTLHPSAREVFPAVLLADESRKVLHGLVRMLGCRGAGFLAGRLLFLLTSLPSDLIAEIALDGACVAALQRFAEQYLTILRSPAHAAQLSTGTHANPPLNDILREHLKLAYNLMLQYSRAPTSVPEGFSRPSSPSRPTLSPPTGEVESAPGANKRFWRTREKSGGSTTSSPDLNRDEASPPDEAEASTSPPRSKSPLAFAKQVVGAVKNSSSPNHSTSTTPKESSPHPSAAPYASRLTEGDSPDSLSLTSAHLFLPLFQPYLALSVSLPLLVPVPATPLSPAAPPSFKDPSPLVRAALNPLLNFPLELEELSGWSTSWLQYVPPRISSDDGTVLRGGGIGSLGERLLDLLRGVCDAYFPPDRVPDEPKVLTKRDREHGRALEPPCAPDEWIPTGESVASKIDEILGPVILLLRKLSMLGEAQFVFRELLFPPHRDRSTPVDRYPTLTGHLVRLLSSVLLPNTSFGVGEFLYNLCDRSPERLVCVIGYGNASGFLQNRGELIPPPAGEDADDSPSINPITGAYDPLSNPADDEAPMSDAEKEREAERLYTLFDRMARTGVISAENPVDRARAEGRLQETSDEREAELERLGREEDELEKEVERDMREWKERRRKAAEQGKDPAQV